MAGGLTDGGTSPGDGTGAGADQLRRADAITTTDHGTPADATLPPGDGPGPVADTGSGAGTGALGAGPRSGYPWLTGCWVNGGADRLKIFEGWRKMAADCVTQSCHGMTSWHQHAGCDLPADVDKELAQSPSAFTPTVAGIFNNQGWKGHIWGGYPATEHRKRLIHLCWMNLLPSSVGNANGSNAIAWYNVMMGSGDKYLFLLGRKFAYLDGKDATPLHALTIDLGYEFTLKTHPDWPGGYYVDPVDKQQKPTWEAYRVGYLRLAKAFRRGYAYQAGGPCPYRFCWRPQIPFKVVDSAGNKVRHDAMFPNDAASWSVKSAVTVGGAVILPAGPLGKQVDLIGPSWHDAVTPQVSGSSKSAAGSNWSTHLQGTTSFWGLDEIASFARQQKVMVCAPEWSARNESFPPVSPHPGDCYRLIHHWITTCLDVFAYDNVFDQGSGNLYVPWKPAQPASQEPATVYRALW